MSNTSADEQDVPAQAADAVRAEMSSPPARPANNTAHDAERTRARQALELQRERILSERTASPHRRSALTDALATVEEQLTELGWILHL